MAGEPNDPDASALDAVQPEWLAAIPGKLIVATHVELRLATETTPESVTAGLSPTGLPDGRCPGRRRRCLGIHRFFFDNGFRAFRARRQPDPAPGRTDRAATRRDRDLSHDGLARPARRERGRPLAVGRRDAPCRHDGPHRPGAHPEDERTVLATLSELAAEVEHSVARTTFRFGAARAYSGLVMQRIEELRETRIRAFQPSTSSCCAGCCQR